MEVKLDWKGKQSKRKGRIKRREWSRIRNGSKRVNQNWKIKGKCWKKRDEEKRISLLNNKSLKVWDKKQEKGNSIRNKEQMQTG